MGYTTEFDGEISIEPPLNEHEVSYLERFAGTRRMHRRKGPYYVDAAGFAGQDHEEDVLDYNSPPIGQPGLWCQWIPEQNGRVLEWDQGEKFYESEAWMAYLIDHFLKPGAEAQRHGLPEFEHFTFDHVLNGVIYAQGEEPDDVWRLIVNDNEVTTQSPTLAWPDLPEGVTE